MDSLVDFLLNFHGPTPYLLTFGILLLCGLGLPVPEDITLFAAGLLAYYGMTDVWMTIVVAFFGVLFGDSIIFWLGATYGRKLTKKWIFHELLPDDRLDSVKRKLHSRGNRLIFAARFMPGFRAPIFFSAGTLHLPYRTFLFYDGLAALLSVPLIIGAVFYFGDNLEQVVHYVQKAEHGMAGVILVIILAIAGKWYITHRKSTLSILLIGLGLLASLNANAALSQSPASASETQKWCSELQSEISRFKWKINPCDGGLVWKSGGSSLQGRSLMYTEFGDPKATNVSLIFSMVHGDEITPVYIGIQLAHWAKEHEAELKDHRVVIAPLVNPDGFYRKPKTRMNGRGVDVNRNFATRDWYKGAKRWKVAFRSDPRRNPGSEPRSEPETLLQEELIRTFKPQKIMSIHAPLNHMDYDGPSALSLQRFPREYVRECIRLRKRLKAKSTGYFPGSLGNYAGRELGIPTITLELPTADATKAEVYWKKFSEGIRTMIDFTMPTAAFEPVIASPPTQVSSSIPR